MTFAPMEMRKTEMEGKTEHREHVSSTPSSDSVVEKGEAIHIDDRDRYKDHVCNDDDEPPLPEWWLSRYLPVRRSRCSLFILLIYFF